ncbi:MAG: acetyl-CoA carboxylase biotin carboxyl carrier protein subunit [Nitrososphaerales archaeon]
MPYEYVGDEGRYSLTYEKVGDEYLFYINKKQKRVKVLQVSDNGTLILSLNGKVYNAQMLENTLTQVKVKIADKVIILKKGDYEKFALKRSYKLGDERFLASKLTGKVVKVLVEKGQRVKEGDSLVILEAMKMHVIIKSDREGVLKAIKVSEGGRVSTGDPLVEFE